MSASSLCLYGLVEDSIVDGPGLRYSVFVQGCPHHCPGCHNEDSWSYGVGQWRRVEDVVEDICANRLVKAVTISGGEPFTQAPAVLELVRSLHERGYNIWIYSGYLFEDLMANKPASCASEILSYCDVLVDGPFVQDLFSHDLAWKGSSNQRVIDLAASAHKQRLVLWEAHEEFPSKPESW